MQQFKCFENVTVSFQFWCSYCKIILCSEKLYLTAQQLLMINAFISIQLCNLWIKNPNWNTYNSVCIHSKAYINYHTKVQFNIKMLSIWKDIKHTFQFIPIVPCNIGHFGVTDKSWRPFDYNIFSFRHMELFITVLSVKVKQRISGFRTIVCIYMNI